MKRNRNCFENTLDWLEVQIRSGECQGFSYQNMYTGHKMALSSTTDHEELFSAGEDPDLYFKIIAPERIQ